MTHPQTFAPPPEPAKYVASYGILEIIDGSEFFRDNEVVFRLGSLPTGIYLIKAVDALGQPGVVRVSKE